MPKSTVVSDYIQNKLNGIKKDIFLEEISNKSFYRQQELIHEEIKQINCYISFIKENKNSYEVVDGKKKLRLAVSQYIKSLKKIIEKYEQYTSYLKLLESYNHRRSKIEDRIELESMKVVISNNQLRLLDTITSNSIKNISFKDLVDISKYMINNFEDLENHSILFEMLQEISTRFLNNSYNEEDYILISGLKCVLSHKINELDKSSDLRKPLREMKHYIKSCLERSNNVLEEKHDYRYEIVEYMLENEYYFNRLLEEMPDIVNLVDKDGYSLAYNVLTKYLDSYLLELQGKKNISKEKYARIYRGIVNSESYKCSKSDTTEISILLNNFKEAIKNGHFRRDKYLKVLSDIDNILVDVENLSIEREFDKEQIWFDRQAILNKKSFSARVDLTKEDAIVITNLNSRYNNSAYSVTKLDDDSYILKVHLTDVREFIKRDSELNEYLKHCMFFNEDNWLSPILMWMFSLEQHRISPVFTFELKVLSNGKIEAFKIYKSNICVNNIYSVDNVCCLLDKKDPKITPYIQVSHYLDKSDHKDNYGIGMCDTFNKTVLDLVGAYFYKKDLPYIYRIQDERNSEIYMKNMTFLNRIFSKISKKDFNIFYQIICEDTNYARYTTECRHHFCLEQKYYTDLFIPLYSYIGIHIQDLINEFYLSESNDVNKNILLEENQILVERANKLKEEKRINKHKQKIKERI